MKYQLYWITILLGFLNTSEKANSQIQVTTGTRVETYPDPVGDPRPRRPSQPPRPPNIDQLMDDPYYNGCGQTSFNCNYLSSKGLKRILRDENERTQSREISQRQQHEESLKKLDNEINSLSSGGNPNGGVSSEKIVQLTDQLRNTQTALASKESDLAVKTKSYSAQVSDGVASILQTQQASLPNLPVDAFIKTPELARLQELNEPKGATFGHLADRLPFSTPSDSPEGRELRQIADRGMTYRGIIQREGLPLGTQRLALLDASDTALLMADEYHIQGDGEDFRAFKEIAQTLIDAALSLTPGVSFARDCYEAISGKNLVTGDDLTRFERSMSILGVASGGLGSKIKNIEKGVEIVKNLITKGAKTEVAIAKAVQAGEQAVKILDSAKSLGWKGTKEGFEDIAPAVRSLEKEGKLPASYISKSEAQALGWDPSKGNLHEVAPGKSIGGDVYKNKNGALPAGEYREADLGYRSGYRGSERIVYSADGKKVYMTNDHYETFTEIK